MDASNLPITSPCPISLDAIGFDHAAKRAYCSHCDKKVHNLSTMTERQAEAVLDSAGQDICVTYNYGADGAVRFKPPTQTVVPISRLRRAAAAVPAVGLAAAMAACTPTNEAPDKPGIETVDRDRHAAGGMREQPPKPRIEPTDQHVAGGIGERPPIVDKPETDPDVAEEPCETSEPPVPVEVVPPVDPAPSAHVKHAKGGIGARPPRGFAAGGAMPMVEKKASAPVAPKPATRQRAMDPLGSS